MLLDYTEFDAMIGRREEWMSAQCLFTGKVTCLDGDTGEVTAELSYGRPAKPFPPSFGTIPRETPLLTSEVLLRLVSSACGAWPTSSSLAERRLMPLNPIRV